MATRIYVTDKYVIMELSVISDGQDFMADMIGEFDDEGKYYTSHAGSDFEMPSEDFEWWAEWAYREQRILDEANARGEKAIDAISRMSAEYGSDLDALHDAQERYLFGRG